VIKYKHDGLANFCGGSDNIVTQYKIVNFCVGIGFTA
jgi:hypothetical protein